MEKVIICGVGSVSIDEMLDETDAVLKAMKRRNGMIQEIRTLTRFKCLLLCAKDGADIRIPNAEYKNYCRYERKYGRLYDEEAEY